MWKKELRLWLLVSLVLLSIPSVVMAATTADVTVTATPNFIAIACNQSTYDFGGVAAGVDEQSVEGYFGITNTSSVQTDQTIAVNATTWAGGVTWAHDDTATAGADQAGLKANRGGTWGVDDIIIKQAAPNFIYENCAAATNYAWGIQLIAPTSFTDGVQKSIKVTITAAAG